MNLDRRKWQRLAQTTFALAAAWILDASTLSAQDTARPPEYLDALKRCQTIAEDVARLACYDSAVGRVITATEEGKVRLIDKEDVEKARRGLFGFSLPKLKLFGDDAESAEPDVLQTIVTKVSFDGRNTVLLTVEEGGAVWRIPSADYPTLQTKPGDTVEFKKASLGSYFIRINGRLGIKGRRVQ